MVELPINQVVCGDCREVMRGWPAESINFVCFSPPYWGLRNYGESTNTVWGGDPNCEHSWIDLNSCSSLLSLQTELITFIEATGKFYTIPNIQEDAKTSHFLVEIRRETLSGEKISKSFGKCRTARRKRNSTQSINCPIAIEYSPNKIPFKFLKNNGENNNLGLLGHDAELSQSSDKGYRPDLPSENHIPYSCPLLSGGLARCDMIPDEFGEFAIFTDKANLPVISNISVGQKQPYEVGEFACPLFKKGKVYVPLLIGYPLELITAGDRTKGARKSLSLPSGAYHFFTALKASKNPSSISASGGAMLPVSEMRRLHPKEPSTSRTSFTHIPSLCLKCGAISCQLGLEPFPYKNVMLAPNGLIFEVDGYVQHMVEVGREIKRILRKDGSWYLNLGDTYAGARSYQVPQTKWQSQEIALPKEKQPQTYKMNDIPPKCKLLMPHRVALALIDDGWVCRNDITWYKPNSMPSSVGDRLTNKTEVVFHLVKSREYYYDLDAIRETPVSLRGSGNKGRKPSLQPGHGHVGRSIPWDPESSPLGKNPGDVVQYDGKFGALPETIASQSRLHRKMNYERQVLGIPHDLASCHPSGKNPGDVVLDDGIRKQPPRPAQQPTRWERGKNIWEERFAEGGKNPGDVVEIGAETRTLGAILDERGVVKVPGGKGWTGHPVGGGAACVKDPKWVPPEGKNPGDFWSVTTKPFKGAHFAVYPEALCERPIKSSCPAQVCRKCGRPRERIVEREGYIEHPQREGRKVKAVQFSKDENRYVPGGTLGLVAQRETIGWTDCGCGAGFESGIVLDPMCGSGTTLVVAKRMGLRYIGIELNPDYCEMARRRLARVERPLDVILGGEHGG